MSGTHPPFPVMVGEEVSIKYGNAHLPWKLVPSPMHCSAMPQILLSNGPSTHLVAEAMLGIYIKIDGRNFHCQSHLVGESLVQVYIHPTTPLRFLQIA